MPHVDRAGQLKKHAANATGTAYKTAKPSSPTEESDLSSEEEDYYYEEIDSDDVDSDGLDDDLMDISSDAGSHALSQQQDFVRF